QFGGYQRWQHRAIVRGTRRRRSRYRPASLHIAFERRDHTIDGIGAGFLFGFAFGQRLRNFREAHEPPAVLLGLQDVPIPNSHRLILQVSSRQPELLQHRAEKTGADFLFAVLQRREPVAVIEPAVATLAGTTIERNNNPAIATEPSDLSLKLVPRHIVISHRSVRISTQPPRLRVLY